MAHIDPRLAVSLAAAALLAACSGRPTVEQGSASGEVATARPVDDAPVAEPPATDPTATPGRAGGSASATPPSEATPAKIPARFVGAWAPDAAACGTGDGYERIHIEPDRVGFFETVGEVRDVEEAGGSTRITLRERVGDSHPVYPIMISLARNGRALNYIRGGERRLYVKCAG